MFSVFGPGEKGGCICIVGDVVIWITFLIIEGKVWDVKVETSHLSIV